MGLSTVELWRAQVLLGANKKDKGIGQKQICALILKGYPDRGYTKRYLKKIGAATDKVKKCQQILIYSFLHDHGCLKNADLRTRISPIGDDLYYIYIVYQAGTDIVKVGVAKDIPSRLRTMQTSNPAKLEIYGAISVGSKDQAFFVEASLHQRLKKFKLRGEWFECRRKMFDRLL